MAFVVLVRHGRTTANASGVLAGWTPGVLLNETGREQAATLGEKLAHVRAARLVSSPLERCTQTARLIRDVAWPGLPIEEDDALGECRYGAWTGRALTELAKEPLWKVVQQQPSAAVFPSGESVCGARMPGESMAQMAARVTGAVRAIDADTAAAHGDRAVTVIVSHGDPIKAVLADAAGTHLDAFQRIAVSPGSVSVVQYTDQRPFVLHTNVPAGGLATILPPTPAHGEAGTGESADGHAVGEGGDAAVGGGA